MPLKLNDLYVDMPHMVVDYNDLADLLIDFRSKTTAGGNILDYAIQWVKDNFETDINFYGERLAMRLNALINIASDLPSDVCRYSAHGSSRNFEFSPDLLAAAAVTPLLPPGGSPVLGPGEPGVFDREKLLHNARVYALKTEGAANSEGEPS